MCRSLHCLLMLESRVEVCLLERWKDALAKGLACARAEGHMLRYKAESEKVEGRSVQE